MDVSPTWKNEYNKQFSLLIITFFLLKKKSDYYMDETNKVRISLLKVSDAFDLYLLGFIIIDKVLFIIIFSILTLCNIPNSSSFVIADRETKAAPKPD
jgi:hypothetical protein